METPIQPLSTSIMAIMYFGDVAFAVSGALTAAKYRMDVLGFVLIGTITGIGGGTLRDLLLGRDVWQIHDPTELLLCITASLITFFFIKHDIGHHGTARVAQLREHAPFRSSRDRFRSGRLPGRLLAAGIGHPLQYPHGSTR